MPGQFNRWRLAAGCVLIASLLLASCNLPLGGAQAPVAYTVGPSGNEVKHSSGARVVVPLGSLKGDAQLSVGLASEDPPLPEGSLRVGRAYQISLSEEAQMLFPLEIYLPLERKPGQIDAQFAAMRWEGSYWTRLQGQVEDDMYHFASDHTTLFRLNYFEAAQYPVEFYNQSMTKVHIHPWTYTTFYGKSAIGSFLIDGRYPDGTSRGWGYLPPGSYSQWCVDWSEFTEPVWDIFGGGYWTKFIGNFHFIFSQPILLNRYSEIEMGKPNTARVRFSIGSSLSGLCGDSPDIGRTEPNNPLREQPMPWTTLEPGQSNQSGSNAPGTNLYKGEALKFKVKPAVIVYPEVSYKAPPQGVTVTPYCYIKSTGVLGNCWSINGLISLLETGQTLTVANANPSTAVGVQWWGSTNDGLARVSVDGKEIWQGSTRGLGPEYENAFIMYLQTAGLADEPHTVLIENVGDGPVAIALIGFGPAVP